MGISMVIDQALQLHRSLIDLRKPVILAVSIGLIVLTTGHGAENRAYQSHEPNLLLNLGILDQVTALCLGFLQGSIPDPGPSAIEFRNTIRDSAAVLQSDLEHRGRSFQAPSVLLKRHRTFREAQKIFEADICGLLSDLATSSGPEREKNARDILNWVASELNRNGIDLSDAPRSVRGKKVKQPRKPITGKSRITPACVDTFSATTDADLTPDPLWESEGEQLAAAADYFGSIEQWVGFVKSQIRLKPGFGFQQHPLTTLESRTGSDFDQAALLVALARAKKIPARYVYFSLAITQDQCSSIWGVSDLIQAGQITAAEGRPAALVRSQPDQPPFELRMEHIAVELYLGREKSWVLVDPSFHPRESNSAPGKISPPLFPPTDGPSSWKEMDRPARQSWNRLLRKRAYSSLDSEGNPTGKQASEPDKTSEDLHFKPLAWLAEFQQAPPGLNVKITLTLRTEAGSTEIGPLLMAGIHPPVISLESIDADAPGQSQLYYPPANQAYYLTRLYPKVLIPGEAPRIVDNQECRATLPWELDVMMDRPLLDPRSIKRQLKAGGMLALGWGGFAKPHSELSAVEACSLWYIRAMQKAAESVASPSGVIPVVEPPILVATALEPVYRQPLEGYAEMGFQASIDQLFNSWSPVPARPFADPDRFVLALGMISSALEHRVLEKVLGYPSLSTVKMISQAPTEYPDQTHPFQAEGMIGIRVLLLQKLEDWAGAAELVLALPSLAGKYDLAGGIRGGVIPQAILRSPSARPFQRLKTSLLDGIPDPSLDRAAVVSSAMAGVIPGILRSNPSSVIYACWAATWFVDGWVP